MPLSGTAAWLLLGLGTAGTLGQIALTRAYTSGEPAQVSIVGLAQIVFAVLLEQLVWGRAYDGFTVAGMALVAAPTAWLLFATQRRRGADSVP